MAKAQNLKQMPKMAEGASGPETRIMDRMYKSSVELSEEKKKQLARILNERLAEASDFYSQAKFAHWNVKGLNFYQLHLLFDKVAEDAEAHIDKIAERITAVGGVANGTIRQAASTSKLSEYRVESITGPDHLQALIEALASYTASVREAGDKIEDIDQPTRDFLNQMIIDLEQNLYFLESHMQSGESQ